MLPQFEVLRNVHRTDSRQRNKHQCHVDNFHSFLLNYRRLCNEGHYCLCSQQPPLFALVESNVQEETLYLHAIRSRIGAVTGVLPDILEPANILIIVKHATVLRQWLLLQLDFTRYQRAIFPIYKKEQLI